MSIRLAEAARRDRATAVLGRAVHDLRDIAALEVDRVRSEVTERAREATLSVALFASGGVLLALSLAMALFAIVLARGGTPEKAFAAAVMLFGFASLAAVGAYLKLPRRR